MIKEDNKIKVLIQFFRHNSSENEGLQLREIGRKINLAPTSVKKYLNELEKEGIVIKKKHSDSAYPIYLPNHDNHYFIYLRNLNILKSFKELGLLDYLEKECNPEIIVVSGVKFHNHGGLPNEIKLFLGSESKKLDLKGYEEKIGMPLTPIFSKDFLELTPEMEEEIINGIVLKGTLRFLDEYRNPPVSDNNSIDVKSEEGFYSRTF